MVKCNIKNHFLKIRRDIFSKFLNHKASIMKNKNKIGDFNDALAYKT